MFEPSANDLKASSWTVEWCMAKLVNKGVLTMMFEPSASYLNASWWIVDSCTVRPGQQGMRPGCSEHKSWWKVDLCMARTGVK